MVRVFQVSSPIEPSAVLAVDQSIECALVGLQRWTFPLLGYVYGRVCWS